MAAEPDEIKEIARAILHEMLSNGAVFPLCQIEKARLDAMERSLRSAMVILTGGDNPDTGLVAKSIRQDGALAQNRTEIEHVKKSIETRGNREWAIWAAVIMMVATTIWNTVMMTK